MDWNEIMDLMMLKEVSSEGVMAFKYKSQERGKAWDKVAESLNCYEGFSVTAKSIRDRYNILQKKLKAKNAQEERESGGGGREATEAETIIENLIELSNETEKAKEMKAEETTKEKTKAEEMRAKAMESLGQTKKRVNADSPPSEKRKRRTSSDAMEWLKERTSDDMKLKETELKQRKEELDLQRQYQENQAKLQMDQMRLLQTQMMKQMDNQQHQQQQQQQQFLMVQQQMMALIQQLFQKKD